MGLIMLEAENGGQAGNGLFFPTIIEIDLLLILGVRQIVATIF